MALKGLNKNWKDLEKFNFFLFNPLRAKHIDEICYFCTFLYSDLTSCKFYTQVELKELEEKMSKLEMEVNEGDNNEAVSKNKLFNFFFG